MNNTTSDEITLKDLILKIHSYFWEVVKYWWIILLFCAVTCSYYAYNHYNNPVKFGAKLKFVVEGQGNGSGSGGLAGLLGSFGMAGAKGAMNPYKILEIFEGSELFVKIMSYKLEDGTSIANKTLEVYNLPEEWAESSPSLKGFKFENIQMLDNSNILQQKALKKLKKFIIGTESNKRGVLTTLDFDEDTGVYSLNSKTQKTELSLALSEAFYKEIKFFFEEELFRDQRQVAEILDAKTDSLQAVRDYKIRELARFENRNRAVIGKSLIAERTIMTMEQQAINQAYAEVFKNREMTDINRRNQKPLFVAVDRPFLPLSVIGTRLTMELIFGGVVGLFLGVVFILFRRIYKDIMSS